MINGKMAINLIFMVSYDRDECSFGICNRHLNSGANDLKMKEKVEAKKALKMKVVQRSLHCSER